MEPTVVSEFLKHGALGLLCLLEAFAVAALWRRSNAVTDARIADVQKLVQVTEQVTTALDKLSDTVLQQRR